MQSVSAGIKNRVEALSHGFGMVQVYYGDGKGKTTAALGQGIRAFGNGKRVAFIYFDKGGDNYNERIVLEKLAIPYFSYGRDRRSSDGSFDFSLRQEDIDMATQSMAKLREIGDQFDLIVLDEVLNAIRLQMMATDDLLKYLNSKPEQLEIILTGRGLPPEIAQRADLITEVKLEKHYFEKGVGAREGIEY
jgi:cob(I)alamin adenosyltransferase